MGALGGLVPPRHGSRCSADARGVRRLSEQDGGAGPSSFATNLATMVELSESTKKPGLEARKDLLRRGDGVADLVSAKEKPGRQVRRGGVEVSLRESSLDSAAPSFSTGRVRAPPRRRLSPRLSRIESRDTECTSCSSPGGPDPGQLIARV